MSYLKEKEKFLQLLEKSQAQSSHQELTDILASARQEVENNEEINLIMVKLSSALNPFVLNNPSKELLELKAYVHKKADRYRGRVSWTSWFR